MQLSAPYTPIEFYDASFNTGSTHTLWCVRVTGAVRYEPMPHYECDVNFTCVLPPDDDTEFSF
jgi:hypothetical protein